MDWRFVCLCVCLIISYRLDMFVWAEKTEFVSAGRHAKALPASGRTWPGSGHTVAVTFLQRSPWPHREGKLSAFFFLSYKHAGFSKSPKMTWTQTFTFIQNDPFGNSWHLVHVYTVHLMGWGHSAIELLFKQLSSCFYLLQYSQWALCKEAAAVIKTSCSQFLLRPLQLPHYRLNTNRQSAVVFSSKIHTHTHTQVKQPSTAWMYKK